LIRDIVPELEINDRLLVMIVLSNLQTFVAINDNPSPVLSDEQRFRTHARTLMKIRAALHALDSDLADVFDRDGQVPPGTPL
jgi:hypothetical protein